MLTSTGKLKLVDKVCNGLNVGDYASELVLFIQRHTGIGGRFESVAIVVNR